MSKEIELECTVKLKTEKAWLVQTGMGEDWVPKSQISDFTEETDGRITSVFVPEWLATEKGLV